MITRLVSAVVAVGGLAFAPSTLLSQSPLPAAVPEALGVSSQRLDVMRAGVQTFIDEGKHAGAVSMIVRDGRIVDWQTYGFANREERKLMEKDTIFRVYSMSKVVTSVAVMMLLEEGKISLSDSIAKHIPELGAPKVFTGGTAENPQLVDAARPPTIKELLTHTSGYTYGFMAPGELNKMYLAQDLWNARSLSEFSQRVAKLPLAFQPGEGWTYGISNDILGCLVEVVSGVPFDKFLERRLFKPLGMADTGFYVPSDKMARLATIYENDESGKLVPTKEILLGAEAGPGKGFPSGGGGLFSTIGDYARFAQMIANGGSLDGVSILGKKTVQLMTMNHLPNADDASTVFSPAWGWGLAGAVKTDVAAANELGSIGEFGWNGAATTTFRVNFEDRMVALLFTQHFPYDRHSIFTKFYNLACQTIIE